MKFLIGLGLCVSGLIVGAYVGIWVCFIGGIVDVISQIRAEHLSPLAIAVGVAKVFFAGVAGYISAACLILPGYFMIQEDDKYI